MELLCSGVSDRLNDLTCERSDATATGGEYDTNATKSQ
jgi:hypothetical protein